MGLKNLKVFLDTSVIFAAVFSRTGGARRLFHLGEAGALSLIVGPTVLREADEVVRRKIPASLPILAQLLSVGQVETSQIATQKQLDMALTYVLYFPDACVLAEAIQSDPDWFVTHDKEHFLKRQINMDFSFKVGTPGDLLQNIKNDFSLLNLE